ncbi:MAG: TlpA family protein disulfide reductase [Rhizobacter sp.]|nr:TlpA family protein disulfide reductase [Rhizobacter sp.]
MKRRQALWMGGVAVAAAAAGGGWGWWRHRDTEASSAAEAALWSERFERPEGGELSLAPLRGQPLILNFWATWCAPCVKELPLLNAFHRDHQADGWQVVGLAVDSPTPVREFLGKLPIAFPVGLAGLNGVDLARSLGNPSGSLPFSVLFDRRGRAVARKLGLLHPEDLADWLSKIGKRQ